MPARAHASPATVPAAARRAFTMVELIVVVVILAIAAVAIVPKFSGTARQDADNSVERVAELLRMFAFRESLGSQQVALWRDPADGRIHLLVKDGMGDAEGTPDWRADRFAAPVASTSESSPSSSVAATVSRSARCCIASDRSAIDTTVASPMARIMPPMMTSTSAQPPRARMRADARARILTMARPTVPGG